MTQLWRTTLEVLDSDGIPVQQRAFLSLAKLVGLLDDTALIAVPNDFTKDIVETRLRDRVTATLGSQLGRDVRLAVTVDPSLAEGPVLDPRTRGTTCGRPTGDARSTTSTSARTRSTAPRPPPSPRTSPSTVRPTRPAVPNGTASPVWSRCPAPGARGTTARCPSRSS